MSNEEDHSSLGAVKDAAAKLESRAYDTYKSRLFAAARLSWWNKFTNNLLVAFSTSTAIASVGMLVDQNMYGAGGDALMVALAILALVASLVVASSNYGTRAKAMESSYKAIQKLSIEAENIGIGISPNEHSLAEIVRLQREYGYFIESSENHTGGDYKRMKSGKQWSAMWAYALFAVPVGLLVPFVAWYVKTW